jgi:polar amino acid transport system substrate-binding protein
MKVARAVVVAAAGVLFGLAAHAQGKELVVGSSATYRPFAYETPSKEVVGYDIDMIKAIAQKSGLQIKIVNTPTSSSRASRSTTSASSPTISPTPISRRGS